MIVQENVICIRNLSQWPHLYSQQLTLNFLNSNFKWVVISTKKELCSKLVGGWNWWKVRGNVTWRKIQNFLKVIMTHSPDSSWVLWSSFASVSEVPWAPCLGTRKREMLHASGQVPWGTLHVLPDHPVSVRFCCSVGQVVLFNVHQSQAFPGGHRRLVVGTGSSGGAWPFAFFFFFSKNAYSTCIPRWWCPIQSKPP